MRDLVRLRNAVRELRSQLEVTRRREPNLPAAVIREIQTQLAATRRLIEQRKRIDAETAKLLPALKGLIKAHLHDLARKGTRPQGAH